MVGTVLIFSGGDPLTTESVAGLPTEAVVIGADSGVDRAHQAGWDVDVAVGDFDSISPDGLLRVESRGAVIRRFPVDKNETDLELAIAVALEMCPERIVMAAMSGGRPDHELAGLMLLTDRRLAGVDVDVVLNGGQMSVVFDHRQFRGEVGDLMSLVPVAGDVTGVTTSGLEYSLVNETLRLAAGRGVSNVCSLPSVDVSIAGGVLFVYRPDQPS